MQLIFFWKFSLFRSYSQLIPNFDKNKLHTILFVYYSLFLFFLNFQGFSVDTSCLSSKHIFFLFSFSIDLFYIDIFNFTINLFEKYKNNYINFYIFSTLLTFCPVTHLMHGPQYTSYTMTELVKRELNLIS